MRDVHGIVDSSSCLLSDACGHRRSSLHRRDLQRLDPRVLYTGMDFLHSSLLPFDVVALRPVQNLHGLFLAAFQFFLQASERLVASVSLLELLHLLL